jgi:5-deoxy-D-glucuronate isomerase
MILKDLHVERFKLEHPLTIKPFPNSEVYVHPLVGNGSISIGGGSSIPIVGRKTVFDPPTRGFLLQGRSAVVTPDSALDLIVTMVETETERDEWCAVEPKAHEIGEGNYRRTVYEILGGDGPSERIRLGETFNVKGGWSSWPPHSFDADDSLAPKFEEVFVPFLRPKDGSALLRRRGKFWDGREVDDAVALRSGEMVEVPLGSHPIVGGPDTSLMYFWAYLCPVAKQYGVWAEDCGGYA